MKKVGNSSSKYDFDGGASLDADIANKIKVIEDYKQAVIDILKKDVRYEDNIPMLPVTKKGTSYEKSATYL